MKHSKIVLLAMGLSFTFAGCVKVLSKRTDDQAWLEYDQEVRQSRSPASRFTNPNAANSILREKLSLVPVRKILLNCGLLASPETCYQSALTLQFDVNFRAIQVEHPDLKTGDYRKEQIEFFNSRSYAQVTDEMGRFHQSLLSGIDLKAREAAGELFQHCENEQIAPATMENFGIFSFAVSEIPKPVYACLTRNWNPSQETLLGDTLDRLGLGLVSSEAKQWIKREQISQIYENELNDRANQKSRAEAAQFSHEKAELFKSFNPKLSEESLLKEWCKPLREKFPYSPVEQWVIAHRKGLIARR